MDCSLLGSSVHGILHPRIMEWIAISFSNGSSQPRDQTQVTHMAGRLFTDWVTREALPWLDIKFEDASYWNVPVLWQFSIQNWNWARGRKGFANQGKEQTELFQRLVVLAEPQLGRGFKRKRQWTLCPAELRQLKCHQENEYQSCSPLTLTLKSLLKLNSIELPVSSKRLKQMS